MSAVSDLSLLSLRVIAAQLLAGHGMKPLKTERLVLSPLCEQDASWIYELQQDQAWKTFIGDRGVSSVADAVAYIEKVNQQIREWGYGLLAVRKRDSAAALGICGLIKRPHLHYPDLGFALFAHARGQGIAFEAADKLMQWASQEAGYSHITAITHADNHASIALLNRLGFVSMGNLYAHNSPLQRFFLKQHIDD